jgi:hypothetical protein
MAYVTNFRYVKITVCLLPVELRYTDSFSSMPAARGTITWVTGRSRKVLESKIRTVYYVTSVRQAYGRQPRTRADKNSLTEERSCLTDFRQTQTQPRREGRARERERKFFKERE